MPHQHHLLESLRVKPVLGLLKAIHHFAVVVLHDFDAVTLALVAGLVALDLILSVLHTRLQLLLLIVKLVLQCKEVLVQRDTVTQKRFIAACLVLLVNLLILEHLDLVLHGGNLAMQVQNDVFMNGIRLAVFLPPRRQLLDLVSGLRQFRVALKFLV